MATRLGQVLLEGVIAVHGAGWFIDGNEFIPDVMVVDHPGEVHRVTATSYLAVEVLSSDRSRDTVMKQHKYAQAGLQRYWSVDPTGPYVTVHHLVDGDCQVVGLYGPGFAETLDLGPAKIELDTAHLVS